ncbi:hypothetical protein NP493_773g00000 [Ridgeia piscesae]|uniref:G2/mitotic-specific cyclin-B3 n=1 Tax=Ridgeia piscesae TaxID=27915 RepID=A0AAD9NLX7_RIDPI|nr:hypothetical protein NP493_773g00000 [Ridgeia piscesae]
MATKRQKPTALQHGKSDQLALERKGMKRGLERPMVGVGKLGKESPKKKRPAFGDITNKDSFTKALAKKTQLKKKAVTTKKNTTVVLVPKTTAPVVSQDGKTSGDVSWEVVELSQGSQSSQGSRSSESRTEAENAKNSGIAAAASSQQVVESNDVSSDSLKWVDVDAEHLNDPMQVGVYAAHIFSYYKERETCFPVTDYLTWQSDLAPGMRAVLVDWLVEIQENFELNHETLYLAVKLVDLYLSKARTKRERLQLVGATALFSSCKFDERCPPVLDDFLYICDDAYTRSELLEMERRILKTLDFDIGIPLSYRFLRRYAKCARMSMETLTLSRYILESSLMDYAYTRTSDSKMAAATLLLAMKMKRCAQWDDTMIHYTGYRHDDLMPLVRDLNTTISAPPHKHLNTIRTKYSHRVFHEVAKISPLSIMQLEEGAPKMTSTPEMNHSA